MRKVTVDRGESGPRWPSPCIAEDRNGFTVFHLPGFAVPKIALVSSLLSPKVRLRSTFFSHLQPSTRCFLSAGAPPSPNSQHSHTFTAPPALRTIPPLPLNPFRRQAVSCWSPHLPPSPFWPTGTEDAMRAQSSRELFRSRPLSQASPRLQVAFPDSLQANIGTS